MKKTILYILISFLFPFYANCQNGKVEYSVRIQKIDEEIPKNIEPMISKIFNYANNQKFGLIFNQNKSNFKILPQAASNDQFDEKMNNVASSAFTTSSDIFLDYTNKKEVHKESDGQLILYPYKPINWKTSTESKTIGGRKCFKATCVEKFIDRKGNPKTNEVIAWFAPSIPYAYGPKNFYGLPGLILELTENRTTYLATKIELIKKEIQINFPKGKTITKDEYEKRLKAQMGM